MCVLNDPGIRHKVIMLNEYETDRELDPQGERLLILEEANHQACDFLSTVGCDGSQLRTTAPRSARKRYQLTEPQSKERIEAIKNASSAGKMFYATHGQHLNSDEFFEARAKAKRKQEIKKLQSMKDTAMKTRKQADTARAIIIRKGHPTQENFDAFLAPELLALASWKLGKTAKGRKEELLKICLDTPVPGKRPAWTRDDEAQLKELKAAAIEFKDTALNVALKQNANAVKANIQ